MTSNELRTAFLEYFEELGHQAVPSSPLPLVDNPTLFFTNAGMNQFVDVFLGREQRPYRRAATAQKCMRVQGKHNDLENVGPSPRHHTFFEMLGNFSFGDYFKSQAIRYAYDFMTKVCQIPAERLWFTVHKDDQDAERIWLEEIGVPRERVVRMGDKTNFWMMGEVGPCGPTSEIHYDWGPEACTCKLPDCNVLLDNDCGRWLEVWNLVFMQYNQDENGVRTPLPKPGVDTGMGLERLTSVMQNEPVTYNTDLFAPAMDRVQALLGESDKERQEHEVAYRVVADHGRAATFLIADGVLPGNLGRNYVLRMIIRRAVRFGRKIGFRQPFLAEIAQTYIEKMGEAYPELRTRRDLILHTLTQEEERFARTLDSALAQLDELLDSLADEERQEIPGDVAFNLYATHGLPLEITRDVAGERGFSVDEAGFLAAREAHAEASGAGGFGQYETGKNVYTALLEELTESGALPPGGVSYDPYGGCELAARIVGLIHDGQRVDRAAEGDEVELVTNATPFYVEAGGEVSDTGFIRGGEADGVMRVDDTRQPVAGLIVHQGVVTAGQLAVGDRVHLAVDDERRADIRRNHTATHILHRELRAHLGRHVAQAGSLVAPDRLRFDFTHDRAVDPETLAQIEADINSTIRANLPVRAVRMKQREAIDQGAMALFGEKYGDEVRTIQIAGDGDERYSFELCGGLHVAQTGEIALFRFVSEGAVAAGVRRVEAVTGRAAYEYVAERLNTLERLARSLNAPVGEVEAQVEALRARNRQLQASLESLQQQQVRGQFERLRQQMEQVNGTSLLVAKVEVPGADELREMADWFRDAVGSGVAVLATVSDGRPLFVAVVTDDLVSRGLHAGNLVRQLARVVGGGGGGRPNMAQAGGRDADKLPEALASVPGLVEEYLMRKAG